MSLSTDALLASMDAEIHQQVISLSNLCAKRNLALPVFRLPPEMLGIIFIHTARDYYESDDGGCFTPSLPTWVNVSYVCSRWRNIALSHPNLWTFHFNVSLHWTEELLLRSQEASLKISCIYPSSCREASWVPSLLDKLLKNSERIQELRLEIPLSFLPDRFSLCASHLEKLEIDPQEYTPMPSIRIIDGDKSPLHVLKILSCSLPWYSFNLSKLKTLFLREVFLPSPLDMAEFLSILNGMKNLTVLHLEDTLPSARTFLFSGGLDISPKITFPHLTLLVVRAPLSTVVALVSCINIPRGTQLSLKPLLEHGSTVDDCAPISSFLGRQFGRRSSGSILRSLFLDASYYFRLTFGLKCDPPLLEELNPNNPLRIFLGEVYDEDIEEMELPESDIHQIIGGICSSLLLGNIQSLHICWPWLSPDFWREILGRLNRLRYMKLSYGDMPDLSLLALPACTSDENSGGQSTPDQEPTSAHMFVPALEELELFRVRFAHHMSQKSLLDIISTRKQPWVRLTMAECTPLYDS